MLVEMVFQDKLDDHFDKHDGQSIDIRLFGVVLWLPAVLREGDHELWGEEGSIV